MKNDSTISEEQITSTNARIEEMQTNSKQRNAEVNSGSKPPYDPAAVSISFAGAREAETQGWITYHSGEKFYYSGTGRMIHGAPIAQGVALPLALVLPPEKLANAKNVTWEAVGQHGGGLLYIKLDDEWLSPIPLPSTGWGIGDWKAEGDARFTQH